MGLGASGITGSASGGASGGTVQQDKQQFEVTDVAGQTVFTCTTITANSGSMVFVDGAYKDFGYARVGQVFTFDVAIPQASLVTISGSTI
jgi:hypothetical protein